MSPMGLYFNVCDGSLSFDFGKAANEEDRKERVPPSPVSSVEKSQFPRRKGKKGKRERDSKLTFKIRVKRLTHPLCSALSVLQEEAEDDGRKRGKMGQKLKTCRKPFKKRRTVHSIAAKTSSKTTYDLF